MALKSESTHGSAHHELDKVDAAIVTILRERNEGVGAKELLEILDRGGHSISQATLNRRLDRLAVERHVVRQGQARATRYRRDPYHDYFSLPPNQRPHVGYNASVLENYRPNVDAWLTEDERQVLASAGGGRRIDASTYSRIIAQKLLVDLSYASSALEGNTYSYLDTQVLIEYGQAADGKGRDETTMILNHKEAINHIINNLTDIEVSVRDIRDIHAFLSRGLSNMGPRDVGAIRSMPIDHIGGSTYKPLAFPQRIEDELNSMVAKARQIEDPFERSLFLLVFISYLQAFKDVNKRTGRLVCNVPLLQAGFAPFSFMDIDKTKYVKGLLAFYELHRVDLIKEAYLDGYVKAASRYDSYSERPREVVEFEFRRRVDIHNCVRDYVSAVADGISTDTADVFTRLRFKSEAEDTRRMLADRVQEIVSALDEGNHIAYGIPRALFATYQEALDADLAPGIPG